MLGATFASEKPDKSKKKFLFRRQYSNNLISNADTYSRKICNKDTIKHKTFLKQSLTNLLSDLIFSLKVFSKIFVKLVCF